MTTLRRSNSFADQTKARFVEIRRPHTNFEDGSKEYTVSTVDLLVFDIDGFIRNKDIARSLNKSGLWFTIIEELEQTCITKIERPTREGAYETVYTVPVIGVRQFLPPSTDDDYTLGAYHCHHTENPIDGFTTLKKAVQKKIKRNPGMFMYWEGKYYDASIIYAHHPEKATALKEIGHVDAPLPVLTGGSEIAEFVKGVSYRGVKRRPIPGCRIQHRCQVGVKGINGYHGTWRQSGGDDYLEIHFDCPRAVTHIGTAGGYPALTNFPSRRTVGRRRMRAYNAVEHYEDAPLLSSKGNGVKQHKFSSHVYVLKDGEGELSWVTSYEVHYRHHLTHKWHLLLVTSGNSDALSEAVLDLRPHFNTREGLFTQALRIRPLTHHHRPQMRVSVYGRDPQQEQIVNSIDETGSQATSKAEDVPTIEYTIADTRSVNACRYVRDGRQYNWYKYDWYYGRGDHKAVKNKEWRATIQDEKHLDSRPLEY